MANPEGVWRTIGGRRIFIKTGQSVSSAMKESGKFKKATKTTKEDLKGADREEQKKINEDYIKEQSKLANEKETRNSSERQKALDELREYSGMDADNAETYNAPLGEIKGRTEQLKKEFAKQESSKVNESNVRKLFDKDKEYKFDNDAKNEPEWKEKNKATLEKGYKEETGTEPYKNGKEKTSFEDYQTWRYGKEAKKQASSKSYKASDLEEGKPYEIDMGNGIKKTAIYMGKDSDGNSAFYDGEGVNGTFAFSDKFVNEKLTVSDNKDDDKFMELHNQLRNRDSNREHKTKMNSAMDLNTRLRENSDTAEKIIADDEWNDVHVSYQGNVASIVNERTGQRVKITPNDNRETLSKKIEDSYKENKTSSNDWIRDAFNQYKKDHPNTKMTIADFKRSNLK